MKAATIEKRIKKNLPKLLKQRRSYWKSGKPMSQRAVSKALGITQGTYSKIETGTSKPNAVCFLTICNYFEISVDEVLK